MPVSDLRTAPKYQKPALILGGVIIIAAAFYAGMWYANPQPIVASEAQSEGAYAEPYGIAYYADNPGTINTTCEAGDAYACALDRENARYAVAKKEYIGLAEELKVQQAATAASSQEISRQAGSSLELLNRYDRAWAVYLRHVCSLQNIELNVIGIGNWNTYSIECRIFETDSYIKNLQFFREGLEIFGILPERD